MAVFLGGGSLSYIDSCETKEDGRASKHNVASACPVNVASGNDDTYMNDQRARPHCMKKGTVDQQQDLAAREIGNQ